MAQAPAAAAHRKAPETWCKGDGRTRGCGNSCTKSAAAARRKIPETWCKGNGRTRFCGDSCTKSAAAAHRKAPETWCKRDGRTRGCGDPCTKSAAAAAQHRPPAFAQHRPPAGLCPTLSVGRIRHHYAPTARPRQKKATKNGTMVRQVHRSGALNWYAMWGRVRISSVLSERSVLQPFC